MKTLHISSTSQKPLCMTCEDLGLICKQPWDEVITPAFSSTQSTPTTESKTKGNKAEHYALSEDGGSQIIPFKSPQQTVRPSKTKLVTWSQLTLPSKDSQSVDAFPIHQSYDPYDASEAAPDHFISGFSLKKFKAQDPTPNEVDEYESMINTPLWRELFRDFTKWSDMHKEAQYSGEEDVTAVFRWSTAMKSRFLNLYITNSIVRAELASATLTLRARSWWLSHKTRSPNLIISFDQLVEWIKCELVPHSSTSDAVNAWSDLSFHGDVNKYITDLERLINHYPLKKESIIIMATKPLGKDIQKHIQIMNLQYGPSGLTVAQLKQAIRNFLSINQYNRGIARDRYQERAVAFQPRPFRPTSTSISKSER